VDLPSQRHAHHPSCGILHPLRIEQVRLGARTRPTHLDREWVLLLQLLWAPFFHARTRGWRRPQTEGGVRGAGGRMRAKEGQRWRKVPTLARAVMPVMLPWPGLRPANRDLTLGENEKGVVGIVVVL
jgi:hypothetical protein